MILQQRTKEVTKNMLFHCVLFRTLLTLQECVYSEHFQHLKKSQESL